ncbi:uncharacterized protein EV420DRAFT_1658995 [Desarmillaria tabescens]|uniref:Uncharacterized protein n=1 Tax=Armillaria tabescens TaxID=1929756 RepID=A0AA39NP79_ARMTA|nr:uncharacterized protein EV420DRAFT_1658995 [Desarmillaria tabescens]KAK0469276.1 hypothetical protein EV420DRAFT_1658995 [Desarmillaria tabescens]
MLSIITKHLGVGSVRYILGILFLLSIRAFPFAWHGRVLWPYFAFHIQYRFHGLNLIRKSTSAKQAATQAWWDSHSPIGKNPFDLVLKYTDWSSPDVCDYNLHLSKTRVMQRYAEHCSLNVFNRKTDMCFVSTAFCPWEQHHFYLSERYPYSSDSKSVVVSDMGGEVAVSGRKGLHTTVTLAFCEKFPINSPKNLTEPLVHCVSISQVCFKIGRITVPPALVLALSGCSDGNYTLANPPSGYLAAQRAVAEGTVKDLLKGHWKDVPKSERWWEESLGGNIEKIRAERLAVMDDIRLGMQKAKAY